MTNGHGFSIRSWSDVVSLIIIVGALASALAWGLKLDNRSVEHEKRITKLEAQ